MILLRLQANVVELNHATLKKRWVTKLNALFLIKVFLWWSTMYIYVHNLHFQNVFPLNWFSCVFCSDRYIYIYIFFFENVCAHIDMAARICLIYLSLLSLNFWFDKFWRRRWCKTHIKNNLLERWSVSWFDTHLLHGATQRRSDSWALQPINTTNT